ncbi:HotDog domain-containing protein [Ilyonectria destructans]|nr:HotDog domain-containing protein [Ilyonectria destructans]
MADSWESNREAADSASAAEREILLNGTPDEKINTWLNLTKNDQGRLRAGEWMRSLIPNLKLVSTNPAEPHPSCTFSYTVQPENCNRLDNLHGGCAATLFDFSTTLPLALVNRPGFWEFMGVSRTLNVTYMRPVPVGEEVLLECEIVQVGRKLATLRGVMRRRSDNALLAVCEHGKVNIDATLKL